MEKLEIIVHEIMADDEPAPMDLENVSVHDTKTTQSDSDTSNDTLYENACAIALKGYKVGKGAGKTGPNGSGTWHSGKGAGGWPSGRRDDGGKKGGKKGPRAADPIGTVTRIKEAMVKAKARVNPILLRLRRAGAHRSKLSIQVGQHIIVEE